MNEIEQDYKKKQLYLNIIIAVVVLIVLIIAGYKYISEDKKDNDHNIKTELIKRNSLESDYTGGLSNNFITVEISGAVLHPGVYKLKKNSTLNDLIILTGGLRKNADISLVNRAEKIEDGQKINIPVLYDYDEYIKNKKIIRTNEISLNRDNNRSKLKNETSEKSVGKKININIASKEELMTLSGIGPRTAENIIDFRKKNKFQTIEDLMKVKRIGKKMFENIREKICVK